jgi:glycosyltransferase involved in cell wall biosynthesis
MTDKINVLFIQSQLGFGADSLIHAHLMRYLDRSRFNVHVACTAGDGVGAPPSLAAIEQIPDIRLRKTIFAPGVRRRGAREIYRLITASTRFPLDTAALALYVKKEKIHVLHGTEKPRDTAYVMGLSRLTGAKSVVHVHVKWSNEYSRVARWAVRNADAVFSISRYVTETIEGMGTPSSRIHTILNCLDATHWNPAATKSAIRSEFGIPDGAPLLASISRLFSWKGQREMVRALAELVKEFPNVRLLIVGEDERYVHGGSFTEELKAMARELGVLENIVFTGQRRDVAAIMAASDIFTLPSFEEPFGVVFLEAMAMKKPIIAINNGGTPEVVEHGKAGLLSEPWDIPGLARNIRTLLLDPALRERMGEYGRARALDVFAPQRMAREAGEAYERIVGGGAAEAGVSATSSKSGNSELYAQN